jgi:filamentous hemagglutinin family protein
MKRLQRKRCSRSSPPARAPLLAPLAAAVAWACASLCAANPNGPNVVSGQATVSANGKTLTVTNSPGAIIQWQGFSIGPDEITRFVQQSSTSSVLNRVVGADPTRLLGQLQSNGRVYLVNPNGIVFGAGARVDVAGLVASTLDLSNADFQAGRERYTGTAMAGTLTQLGTIRTPDGGRVLLIAPTLENDGVIVTPRGELLLAAGRSVQLADAAAPELRVTVSAPAGAAVNLGLLIAQGGRIGIQAGLVVNNGTISADRAETGPAGEVYLRGSAAISLGAASRISADGADGGRLTLDASGGTLSASGRLSAAGASGVGGAIHLAADRIALDAAGLDASGATRGGSVLIGGAAHGAPIADGSALLAPATGTRVSADSRIDADARTAGNGGTVIVWSNEATQFAGAISARGGAGGGNGGFVETSGKGSLDFEGSVDTRAPHGASGTLLLDPTDLTISSGASTGTMTLGGGCGAGTYCDTTTTPSNLNVNALTTQLGLSNVTVSTASALAGNGDITVNSAVSYNSANTLTLSASRSITLASTITNNGTGSIVLTGSGAGSIGLRSITAKNGNVTVQSGSGGVTLANANTISASAGSISIDAGGGPVSLGTGTLASSSGAAAAISIANASTLALGNISLTGGGMLSVNLAGAGTQTAATTISGTGGIIKQGPGTLTLPNANTYSGATQVQSGSLIAGANNALGTAAGGTTVANGATLGISGGINYATAEPVTVNGNGDAGSTRLGAIDNVAGANSFAWPITLASASTIGAEAGTGTASGTIAAAGNALTFATTGNVTASGVISGAGSTLTKNGAGTLTLSNAASTFTGAVTLNAGTTSVTALAAAGSNSSLGTGAGTAGISLGSGSPATLSYTGGTASTDRAITIGGAGGATLQATAAAATLTLSGGISGGGNPLAFAGAGSITEAGVISGAGTTLTMNGTNALTLGNVANTFDGAVTLNSGTTWAAQAANAGTASSFGTGAVTPGISLGNGATAGSIAFNPASSPSSDRVITLNGPGNVRSTTAGQTVTLTGGIVGNGYALTIGPGGSGNLAISGVISGVGTTLTDSQAANTALLTLSGVNTYSGATTITAGTTIVSQDANLGTAPSVPTAGSLALGGGILRSTATMTLSADRGIALGGAGGIVSTDPGTTLTYAGVVAGTSALTKQGTGTLVLAGSNTYSGLTTVSAGVLDVQSNAALGTTAGATTITSGAALQIDGSGLSIAEPITLAGTGVAAGGALRNVANNNNWAGAVTLGAASRINSDAGTLTLSGTATIAGTFALTVGGAGNTTLNGVLGTATGTLTKDGAGTLTLGAAETFTGLTTVSLGTLRFSGAGALSANDAVSLANAAGVTFDLNATSQTIGSLAGGGASGGVVTSSSPGPATLTTGAAGSTTFSGAIQDGAGSVALVKQGVGTSLTLAHANTFSGGTTIKAGSVIGTAASPTVFGTGSVTLGDSTGGANAASLLVQSNGQNIANPIVLAPNTTGTLTIGNAGAANSTTFSGGVTGSNDLTIASAATTGTITLAASAVNNAGAVTNSGAGTGATTVSAPVGANVTALRETSTSAAFKVTGGLTVNPGGMTVTNSSGTALLTLSGGVGGAGDLVLHNDSATASGVTVSGATVNNAGHVVNAGSGGGSTLVSASIGTNVTGVTQSSASSALTLSGSNTYAGTTQVLAGTLSLSGGSAIPDSGAVAIANASGATLNLLSGETIGNLSGGGAAGGAVTLNANTLTTGDASSTTFSGVISGAGGIVKQGSGSFTLAGANSYSGVTSINAGTLVAAQSSALGSTAGSTTVASGATLRIANAAVGNEPVTLTGAGVGGAGALIGTGSASLGGNLTLAGATTLGSTAATDALDLGGTVNGAFALTQAGAGTVRFSNAVGGGSAPTSFTSSVGSTTDVHGGLLRTGGAQTFNGALVVSAPATLQTSNAAIVANAAVTANAGILTLATGSGNVTMTNAANAFGTVAASNSGAVDLLDSQALTLNAASVASLRARTSSGDLTVNGSLAASAGGDAIVLAAAGRFVNNAGAGALAPTAGRWLVWSQDPAADTRGGLAYAFKQYAATYGVSSVLGSGNGFLYTVAPTITASLAGTAAKVYDATTSATLAPSNYTTTGAIDGDTVTVSTPAVGHYDTRNVGAGKAVSASGVSLLGAANGAATVYGYQLASASANGAIGTITPASLVIGASADAKTYDGSIGSAAQPHVVSGLQGSDSVSAMTQAFDSRNAGSRTLAVTGYAVNDGNGGNNYTVSTSTAVGSIARAALLLGASSDSKTYDGTTASGATPTVSGLVSGDTVSGLAQAFDSRNAGPRTLAVTGYTVNDGNGGNNYTVSTSAAAGSIAKAALLLDAAGDSKTYDGTTASSATPTVSGLLSGDTVSGLAQAFDSRNAGARTLTVTGYAVNDGNGGNNYAVSSSTAAGSIARAALVLGASSDSKTYDGTSTSNATPTVVSGLVAGDSVTALAQTFDSRNAGSRTLAVTGYAVNDGNGGGNYSVTANTAAGTIAPAALVVTADDKSRATGQPNPAFTATYAGFVGGDTPAVLGGALAVATPATSASPPGAYPIVPSGLTSADYRLAWVNGTLTVVAPAVPPPPFTLEALRQRDARLIERAAVTAGARADCRPVTPNERVCVGWPLCEVERPVCAGTGAGR